MKFNTKWSWFIKYTRVLESISLNLKLNIILYLQPMGFHDPSLSRSIFLCCEKILKMGQIMYFKGTVKEK